MQYENMTVCEYESLKITEIQDPLKFNPTIVKHIRMVLVDTEMVKMY